MRLKSNTDENFDEQKYFSFSFPCDARLTLPAHSLTAESAALHDEISINDRWIGRPPLVSETSTKSHRTIVSSFSFYFHRTFIFTSLWMACFIYFRPAAKRMNAEKWQRRPKMTLPFPIAAVMKLLPIFFENKFKCENFPVADHDAVDVLFISFLPLYSHCVKWCGLARTNLWGVQ